MGQSLPEIQVDELMGRIREKIQQQKGYLHNPGTVFSSVEGAIHPVTLQLPRFEEPILEPDHNQVRHLNDFLLYQDQQFVVMAYRFILKRHVDGAGAQHYLNCLREGRFSKVEIIGRLRYSPEGRARGVLIKGLWLPLFVELLGKVPILGFMARWSIALVRLPVFVKHFKTLDTLNRIREQQLRRQMDQWAALLETAAADTMSQSAFKSVQEKMFDQMSQLSKKLELISLEDHNFDEMAKDAVEVGPASLVHLPCGGQDYAIIARKEKS